MSQPKIIVIGGGVAGLSLAQALRKRGITCKLFERDADPSARLQGWGLTLSTSISKLRSELPEDLGSLYQASITRDLGTTGSQLILYDAVTGKRTDVNAYSNTPIKMEDADPNAPIRVNRRYLREYLLQNIDVQWNKKLTYYSETADKVVVHFADGTSETGDILIGADGVQSRVRAVLLGQSVSQAWAGPVTVLTGTVKLDEEQTKRQLALSQTMYLVKETGHHQSFCGLTALAVDLTSSTWNWAIVYEDSTTAEPDYWLKTATQKDVLDVAQAKSQNTRPELRELIALSKPEDIIHFPNGYREWYPPYPLPEGRVMLLGDAVHAMPPHRGQGANVAIIGAVEAASAIAQAVADRTSLPAALKPAQDHIVKRGRTAVNESHQHGINTDNETYAQILKNTVLTINSMTKP